ncbi:MAG TPA: peptidase C39 family protein, partial [Streptomyces sp.]|nr:peptidase C39 family protein [Streptomyces sp.]
MARPSSRRTMLSAVIAAVAGAGALSSSAVQAAAAPGGTLPDPEPAGPAESAGSAGGTDPAGRATAPTVDNRFWTSYTDWRSGFAAGTRAVAGSRPGLVIEGPTGRTDYTDPHTGRTTTWEYGT